MMGNVLITAFVINPGCVAVRCTARIAAVSIGMVAVVS
jgi:hypothetical protein